MCGSNPFQAIMDIVAPILLGPVGVGINELAFGEPFNPLNFLGAAAGGALDGAGIGGALSEAADVAGGALGAGVDPFTGAAFSGLGAGGALGTVGAGFGAGLEGEAAGGGAFSGLGGEGGAGGVDPFTGAGAFSGLGFDPTSVLGGASGAPEAAVGAAPAVGAPAPGVSGPTIVGNVAPGGNPAGLSNPYGLDPATTGGTWSAGGAEGTLSPKEIPSEPPGFASGQATASSEIFGQSAGGVAAATAAPPDYTNLPKPGGVQQSATVGDLNAVGSTPASSSFFGDVKSGFGDVMNWLKENRDVIGLGVGGAGIAKQLLAPQQPTTGDPTTDALRKQLLQSQLNATNRLTSGEITPEQQQQINNNLQANISAIKAKYASLGMSGSTTEQQEISSAMAQATGQAGGLQLETIRTGLQGAGMAQQEANQLIRETMGQDAALSNAIAAFAAAASGGPYYRAPA
jgi:hypothetical protein